MFAPKVNKLAQIIPAQIRSRLVLSNMAADATALFT